MPKNSTLFVRDLVFSGVHGATGREKLDPQRFKVDLELDLDIAKSAESDNLADTYDYCNAVEIVRSIIEDESHTLIEKIATRIAERIAGDPKIFSVKVVIKKIDASHNGYPGIIYSHKRSPAELV